MLMVISVVGDVFRVTQCIIGLQKLKLFSRREVKHRGVIKMEPCLAL